MGSINHLTQCINRQINLKMDSATLKECQMPQELIDRIEEDLTPFDFEPSEDIRKLE